MTAADRARFKTLLETRADEIRAHLARADPADDSIVPDCAIGRVTRMEAIQAQAVTAEGRRRLKTRLRQIAAALDRIERGTYGQCVRCGAAIPRGRLEIMPESHRCVACAGA